MGRRIKFNLAAEIDEWKAARETHPWLGKVSLQFFIGFMTATTKLNNLGADISHEELAREFEKAITE
jgi:hypothetical protein